jgi:uncharacterized protein
MHTPRLLRGLVALTALALGGCARGDAPAEGRPAAAPGKVASGAEVKDASAWFPLRLDGHPLQVQVVVTLDEMQRGLMGRTDLGPEQGMVFVYPAPQQMSFWMKNTPTPLDIGFFTADGVLGEVYPLYPYDTTTVASRGYNYTLALEVNQGWFARQGVKLGARLDLAALAEALRARGFRPERYGVIAK